MPSGHSGAKIQRKLLLLRQVTLPKCCNSHATDGKSATIQLLTKDLLAAEKCTIAILASALVVVWLVLKGCKEDKTQMMFNPKSYSRYNATAIARKMHLPVA